MLLKYKRKIEELLLNSNALNIYEYTIIIHEEMYDIEQEFIFLIYNL